MDLEYGSHQLDFLTKKQKQSRLNSKLMSTKTAGLNGSFKKNQTQLFFSRLETYNQQRWDHKKNTVSEAGGITSFYNPKLNAPAWSIVLSHMW